MMAETEQADRLNQIRQRLNNCLYDIENCSRDASQLGLLESQQELLKAQQGIQRILNLVNKESAKPAQSAPDANPMPEGSWGPYNKPA